MQCPICTHRAIATEAEQQMQACAACAHSAGLIPMPPATRPPTPCRCGSRKFLRAFPREHSVGSTYVDHSLGPVDKVRTGQASMPMMLTHNLEPDRERGLMGTTHPINIKQGWGLLEVYACYACGLVEWFCGNVQSIPIHPHLMTEVVDYDVETHPLR